MWSISNHLTRTNWEKSASACGRLNMCIINSSQHAWHRQAYSSVNTCLKQI